MTCFFVGLISTHTYATAFSRLPREALHGLLTGSSLPAACGRKREGLSRKKQGVMRRWTSSRTTMFLTDKGKPIHICLKAIQAGRMTCFFVGLISFLHLCHRVQPPAARSAVPNYSSLPGILSLSCLMYDTGLTFFRAKQVIFLTAENIQQIRIGPDRSH